MRAVASVAVLAFPMAWLADALFAGPPDKAEPPVRLLREWHRPSLDFGPMRVIRNADELAKAIPDRETAGDIRNKVDFAKERLVGFSRAGGSDGKMTAKVVKGDKERVVTFHYAAGKRKDKALNSFLFAVPNDVTFAGEPKEAMKP